MLKIDNKMTSFCTFPWRRIKIDPQGYAAMCCFQRRCCLGNVIESGLEGVWHSYIANKIRQETAKQKLHETCNVDSCPHFLTYKDNAHEFDFRYYPTELEIDLPNTWCNIGGLNPTEDTACMMCERSYANFTPHEDRVKEVCAILRPFMHNFRKVHIQGVAEPFWKDRIFEIMDDLNLWEHKDNTTVTTTTNGTVLKDDRISKWLELPYSGITFSMDASTPETYKKIRRLDMYDKVVDNLKKVSQRRVRGSQFLYIHNNINIINVGEVIGMVALAHEAQVDHLEFNPTYGRQEITINKENVHLFKKAKEQIIETAEQLGVRISFLRDLTLDFQPELVQISLS